MPGFVTYDSHREQRSVFSRRLYRLEVWNCFATRIDPPFQAHPQSCDFKLLHSPKTAENAVGIRIPYVCCREWHDKSLSFPSHLVFRNGWGFWRSRLESPHLSAFGNKITASQVRSYSTALSKATTSNWFIFLTKSRSTKEQKTRQD